MNCIILATFASIFCSMFIIIIITNNIIDPYIKDTNWGVNLFNFYENNKEPNKIYIIGSSPTFFGIDPQIVQKNLQANNILYNVFSTAYSHDIPIHRIFEIEKMAASKPKIVVICCAYNWLMPGGPEIDNDYFDFRTRFASNSVEINQIEKTIYTEDQLNSIKLDPIHLIAYKRQYLIQGMSLLFSNLGIIDYKPAKPHDYDLFDFKNQYNPGNKIYNKTREAAACIICDTPDNYNKLALRYMINYLRDRSVYVVLVEMPVVHAKIAACTQDQSTAFSRFASSMGCAYYDLSSFCPSSDFLEDGIHPNIRGRLNITRKMTEILSIEAKNVAN